MRGNKKWMAALAAGLFLVTQAQAHQLVFDGDRCPIPIAQEPGAMVEEIVECSQIDLVGKTEDGQLIAVYSDDQIGYVAPAQLEALLSGIELPDVPDYSFSEIIQWRSSEEGVMFSQQNLADLGYLDPSKPGSIDGLYGSGTAGAISAYQADHGLQRTGFLTVDEQITLAHEANIASGRVTEIRYPISFEAKDVYEDIFNLTDWDLQVFADEGWKLEYDVFDGIGSLNSRASLGAFDNQAAPADRVAMNAVLRLRITGGTTEKTRFCPAVFLTVTSASGAYPRSLTLRRGGKVISLEPIESDRGLLIPDVQEKAVFELTEEAMALLADSEKGKLGVRITGMRNTFDLDMDGIEEQVCAFCDALNSAEHGQGEAQ